ncbi:MAG TPA: hypothetical protein DCQ31_11215 [Bacteroidales bacterium]|nr:hypothetical protein [Bacteroidales bacterium]
MLQRIQSVYLFAVFTLFVLMFQFPIVELISAGSEFYILKYRAVMNPETGKIAVSAFPLAYLLLIIALIAMANIFMYKKRVWQMRVSILNAVLMAGSLVLIGYYSFKGAQMLDADLNISFPVLFPVVGLILNILAIGAIRKDENLVRSVDRIR